MPATFDLVRRLALALPDVREATSYGTPAFFVGKKLMLRMWEDGETLVVKVPMEQRADFLEASPDVFFLTDHYLTYPAMLVKLHAVSEKILRERIAVAWQCVAPPKLRSAGKTDSEL